MGFSSLQILWWIIFCLVCVFVFGRSFRRQKFKAESWVGKKHSGDVFTIRHRDWLEFMSGFPAIFHAPRTGGNGWMICMYWTPTTMCAVAAFFRCGNWTSVGGSLLIKLQIHAWAPGMESQWCENTVYCSDLYSTPNVSENITQYFGFQLY